MINLLPEENKKEFRAARMNVTLLRYNILALLTLGVFILSIVGFYVYLSNAKANAETANSENQSKANSFSATKKEAEEYRANLLIAKEILSKKVDYTSVVFAITELLPKKVILDNIDLTAQTFGSQTAVTAKAANYDAVIQLKKNFQESKVFSNVYFQTIDNSGQSTDSKYPISINISVKVNKVVQ